MMCDRTLVHFMLLYHFRLPRNVPMDIRLDIPLSETSTAETYYLWQYDGNDNARNGRRLRGLLRKRSICKDG
jgi:hypothetical protein